MLIATSRRERRIADRGESSAAKSRETREVVARAESIVKSLAVEETRGTRGALLPARARARLVYAHTFAVWKVVTSWHSFSAEGARRHDDLSTIPRHASPFICLESGKNHW